MYVCTHIHMHMDTHTQSIVFIEQIQGEKTVGTLFIWSYFCSKFVPTYPLNMHCGDNPKCFIYTQQKSLAKLCFNF